MMGPGNGADLYPTHLAKLRRVVAEKIPSTEESGMDSNAGVSMASLDLECCCCSQDRPLRF